MKRLGRKAAAIVAPLALTVGLLAPSMASAASTGVLPSTAIGEYTGVNCTSGSAIGPACSATKFLATSPESILGPGELANCIVELEGTINANGSTSITRGNVALGEPICEAIKTVTPWANQICEYKGSTPHQFWDRLQVEFTVGEELVKGPIFVHLTEAGATDNDPLHIQEAHAPESEIGAGPFSITADGSVKGGLPFVFAESGFSPVFVTSNTSACSWASTGGVINPT